MAMREANTPMSHPGCFRLDWSVGTVRSRWPRLLLLDDRGTARCIALDEQGESERAKGWRATCIELADGKPILEAVEAVLDAHAGLPVSNGACFGAGWIGALAFGFGQPYHDPATPQAFLAFHPWVETRSPTGTWSLVGTNPPGEDLTPSTVTVPSWHQDQAFSFDEPIWPNADHHRYCVDTIRSYIGSGEVYQTNLTAQVRWRGSVDPRTLYHRLRKVAQAPYGGRLHIGAVAQESVHLVSASPECFLSVRDGKIASFPIKGTIARSDDPVVDQARADELLASAKDRAECMMIVDMTRNDLAQACVTGSVIADSAPQLQSFPTVHHLVGSVSGSLIDRCQPSRWLRSCFPPASISGCPKIAALKIINDLEEESRGFYTGTYGWFGRGGDAELAVTIRTAIVSGHELRWGTGGGITWDSNPESEWQELKAKVAVMEDAISARSGKTDSSQS